MILTFLCKKNSLLVFLIFFFCIFRHRLLIKETKKFFSCYRDSKISIVDILSNDITLVELRLQVYSQRRGKIIQVYFFVVMEWECCNGQEIFLEKYK